MPYFRHIKVSYSNGQTNTNTTAMAAHLTDKQMLEYFSVGTLCNIGHIEDNMQTIVKAEILKSPEASEVLQLMDMDYSYKEALDIVTYGWDVDTIGYLERELNRYI